MPGASPIDENVSAEPTREDPVLQAEAGHAIPRAVTAPLPFEKPEHFHLIPDDVIARVHLYLPPVIHSATGTGRDINVRGILENAKAMFVDGPRYRDKEYWIQHCASSVREILVFIAPEHFERAHQNMRPAADPTLEKALIFLINAVTYLSSVVHHRQSQLMGDAEKLYPGQGYGQMSAADFKPAEKDVFERICIDVVYTLSELFSRYCENAGA